MFTDHAITRITRVSVRTHPTDIFDFANEPRSISTCRNSIPIVAANLRVTVLPLMRRVPNEPALS